MIALDLLWWLGWGWVLACAALPFAAVAWLGLIPALLLGGMLAPWTTLAGLTLLRRLLPASEPGRFQMFTEAGSIRWAIQSWAPSVYLALFQPIFFQSPAFARLALRALGARLGSGAQVTSRTVIREPHHVGIGRDSLIGEFVHLVCSYQPSPGRLIVGRIEIGDRVLVGAHSLVAPGARIGSRCRLEYQVGIGAGAIVGEDTRIGAGTIVFNAARVGDRVVIGKRCTIPRGAVVPSDTVVPDGTWFGSVTSAPEHAGAL